MRRLMRLRWIALRNLLLLCCAVLTILLVMKGIGIYHKIQAVESADRYYTSQKWIDAEAMYRAARDNTYIAYEEDHIQTRLGELMPITAWNDIVSASASRLQATADTRQFDAFLTAYTDWMQLQEQQKAQQDRFQSEYGKITQRYGIEQRLLKGFTDFRTSFTAELQRNLDQRKYDDESAKWNLLRIPAAYWLTSSSSGDGSLSAQQQHQQNELRQQFKQYDTTKLTRLAAAGNFDAFLSNATATWQAYQQHAYGDANWIATLVNTSSQAILAKDIAAKQTTNFVQHALSFRAATTPLGLSSSPVLTTIDEQIASLQEQAFSLTTSKQYSQALGMYEALSPLADMTSGITQTKLAWATHQPGYILQSSNPSITYEHTVGGTDWQAFPVYAIATDNSNHLFFGHMDKDAAVSVWSGQIGQSSVQIQQLTLDQTLSTAEQPVVTVQSSTNTTDTDSGAAPDAEATPNHLFSLYAVTATGLKAIATLPGASYEVMPDRSIIVHVLPDSQSGVGQMNTYIADTNGVYTQTDSRPDQSAYTAIDVTDIEARLNVPITFSGEIVVVDDQGAILNANGSYVRLRGDVPFSTGMHTLYGRFNGEYDAVSREDVGASSDGADSSTNGGTPDGTMDNSGNGTSSDTLNEVPSDPNRISPDEKINIPVVQVDRVD